MRQVLCPELVGREGERAKLIGVLKAAQDGRGGLVFISGEPGVGKSPLAREVVSPVPTLHLYAQPDDPGCLAAQQALADEHAWFQVHKLSAASHLPVYAFLI